MGIFTDRKLVRIMRRNGIDYPWHTLRHARKTGLELALACAVLEKETGGGANIFGHDKDVHGAIIFHGQPGRVDVTEERYKAYKVFRDIGPSKRMQGVGPMQLTWYALQDKADDRGGCWQPSVNIRIGFEQLAANIKAHGVRTGIRMYNGSGAAAEAYAEDVLEKRAVWRRRLV